MASAEHADAKQQQQQQPPAPAQKQKQLPQSRQQPRQRVWPVVVVLAVLLVAYALTPPVPFADRLAALNASLVTIDNAFYDRAEYAETWHDPHGWAFGLHAMNSARVPYFELQIRLMWPNLLEAERIRVLDVGCGGGIVSEALAKKGLTVTGVDISNASVTLGNRRATAFSIRNLNYVQGSAYKLPFADASFEAVVMSDVLEHLEDVPRALGEVARVLRPNGVLVFDTINRNALSYWLAIVGAERVLRWLPQHNHDWRLFITPEELRRALGAQGMLTCETQGLQPSLQLFWPPTIRSYAVGGHQLVSYIGYARKSDTCATIWTRPADKS